MIKDFSDRIKVLFVAYPRIGLNLGGLEIQIQKTAEALSAVGVEVVFYDPWKNQLNDVDICHVFSLDGTLVYHMQRALEMNKPVIISPVFNSFKGSILINKIKVMLGKNLPGMYTDLNRADKMLAIAKRILALNEPEKNLLIKAFKLPNDKCFVIPNGIDVNFSAATPDLFLKKYGINNFVLQVASIEPRKNQLNLIKAFKNLPYKLVLIGKVSTTNQSYFEECKSAAGDNVLFLGQIDHDDPLLPSAFSAAKLFVLPSYSEVMPLTIYEAAMAGCKLAVSKNVPLTSNIESFVPTFLPDNYAEIAKHIDQEMSTPCNPDLLTAVTKMPTWLDIASTIKRHYIEIINENHT